MDAGAAKPMMAIRKTEAKRSVTGPRIALALLCGALFAALVSTIEYLLGLYRFNGVDHFVEYWVDKGTRVFLFSFVVWLVSLVIFGGPVWYFLHKRNWTSFLHAAAWGAIIPFVVLVLLRTNFLTGRAIRLTSYYGRGGQQWEDGKLTLFGWRVAIETSFYTAVVGLFIGIIIWLLAYRTNRTHQHGK